MSDHDKQSDVSVDRRNVVDKYRHWTVDAIKTDLDTTRFPLEIAIENLERDFNMGTIVRSANAFNVRKIHIVGRRQWNKRGAMVTDKYMNIEYHASVEAFAQAVIDKRIIAIDNVDGATELAKSELPARDLVLVFGSESNGLSDEMLAISDKVVAIEQFGSTRSLNVGVAAGVIMYDWLRRVRL